MKESEKMLLEDRIGMLYDVMGKLGDEKEKDTPKVVRDAIFKLYEAVVACEIER